MLDEKDALVLELNALGCEGARMDAVAADLASGAGKFAPIGPSKLAKLLGLDPDDNADWGRGFYASRVSLDNLGLDQPCAEHLKLLKGAIPADRYAELEAKATMALESGGRDLRLRKEECLLLEEELTKGGNPFSDLVHISTELESPSGEYLEFEGLVGDGGDVCEFYGPYELERGEGVELDDYVCIE